MSMLLECISSLAEALTHEIATNGSVSVLVVSLGSVPVMVHVLNVVVVVESFEENRTLINGSIKPISQHSSNAFVP